MVISSRIAKISSVPEGAEYLMDVAEMSGPNIQSAINSIFDGALRRTNTSKDLPGLYRTTNVKSDIEGLVRKLSPLTLGLMRNDLHVINKVLVPAIVTDDMEFHTTISVFEHQLPGQVAPMGTSRMMEQTSYSNMTHMTRYGFSFMMDGDVRKLAAGRDDARIKLMQLSASFMQLLVYNTIAALGESDPETNYMFTADLLSEREYVERVMDRVHWAFSAHKLKKGFFNYMLKQKMDMTAQNGVAPTDIIFPAQKAMVFANSDMLTDYQHAGDTAHDMFMGKLKIETIHGLAVWPAPTVANTGDRYGQLECTRRLGNYAVMRYQPEADPECPGIYLFDLQLDSDRFIPLNEVVTGFMYMEKADATKPEHHLMFKLSYVMNVHQILTDLGLDRLQAFQVRDGFNSLVAQILNGYRDGTWEDAVPAAYRAITDILDANVLPEAGLDRDSDTAALINAAENVTANPANDGMKYTFRAFRVRYFGDVFGNIAANEGPTPEMCVNLLYVLRVKIAIELHKRTGGAFMALFKQGGAFAFTNNLVTPTNKVFQEMSVLPSPTKPSPVLLLNVSRLLAEHIDMPFFNQGSFYFENDDLRIPHLRNYILTPVRAFEIYDFIHARVADTVNTTKVIIMNRGKDVAFAAMSKPNLVTNRYASDQSEYAHLTQHLGVHVVNPTQVRNVPDTFYNGAVGGANSKIMTHDDIITFRKNQFVFPHRTFPSVTVIPVPKGSCDKVNEFLNARGTMEIRGFEDKKDPDYPNADYWSWIMGWRTAISEYMWTDNRRNIIATALLPCAYGFTDRSGRKVMFPGNTHHGLHGEAPGARAVRQQGDRVYHTTED